MDYNFIAQQEESGQRLDLFLVSKMQAQGFSRSYIQKQVLNNRALVNSACAKAKYKVKAGDVIQLRITQAEKPGLIPEKMHLNILYEDDDVLVIDKPAGLVVHPGAGNESGTLVNGLLFYTDKLSCVNPQRPGIVHRLDKETSGVMVIARNNPAHLNLVKQFTAHSTKRKYAAIVKGVLERDEGIIDLPLGKHRGDFRKQSVNFIKSKQAVTRYKVIERYKDMTMVELSPQTGRTHQLRVHLSYIGHPIMGDTKYGKNNSFPRMALHAKELGFKHPRTKELLSFSSAVPFTA